MNTESAQHQQARQDRLEALYTEDGRHDRDHPMHGLYSGLEQMARWRDGCLATPLPIGGGWMDCVMRRAKAHIAAGCLGASGRELHAVGIFLGISSDPGFP